MQALKIHSQKWEYWEIEMKKREVYSLKKKKHSRKVDHTINLVHFNFCDFLACNIPLHNTSQVQMDTEFLPI